MNLEDAVVAIAIHFDDPQHKQILWGRMSETMLRMYKKHQPQEPRDMVVIQGSLKVRVTEYCREFLPDVWESLSHEQQLIQEYQLVADYLGEQLYFALKGKPL